MVNLQWFLFGNYGTNKCFLHKFLLHAIVYPQQKFTTCGGNSVKNNGDSQIAVGVLNAYIEAINSRDFSQVSKLLHENAVFYIDNKVQADLKQIAAYHEHFWNTLKDSKFWASDIDVIHSDCKCHVYLYQYKFSGYMDGKFVEGSGRSTDVFVQNDMTEQWQLLHEHSSGD